MKQVDKKEHFLAVRMTLVLISFFLFLGIAFVVYKQQRGVRTLSQQGSARIHKFGKEIADDYIFRRRVKPFFKKTKVDTWEKIKNEGETQGKGLFKERGELEQDEISLK